MIVPSVSVAVTFQLTEILGQEGSSIISDPNFAVSHFRRRCSMQSHHQSVDVGAIQHGSQEDLAKLAFALKDENGFLADELLVKNQTITAMGNALSAARTRVVELGAKCSTLEQRLSEAVDEVSKLRFALEDAAPRTAELERIVSRQNEDIKQLKGAGQEQQDKLESVRKLEQENQRLAQEHAQMTENIADWKSKVKEALKENRRKEQAQEKTEIELRTQLNGLQEQLNKASFELQAFRAKESKVRSNIDTQTDEELLTPLIQLKAAQLQLEKGPFSPLSNRSTSLTNLSTPPLPMRSQSRAGHGRTKSGGEGEWKSPGDGDVTSPPAKPPPQARMIVTVHFGSADGWTVDTKHVVNPGMTVTELIRNCCGTINARHDQSLDETAMCLKMMHGKAKRMVTLADHRELHSFAVFHKFQKENVPIVLTLDHKKDEPWDEFLSPRYGR